MRTFPERYCITHARAGTGELVLPPSCTNELCCDFTDSPQIMYIKQSTGVTHIPTHEKKQANDQDNGQISPHRPSNAEVRMHCERALLRAQWPQTMPVHESSKAATKGSQKLTSF